MNWDGKSKGKPIGYQIFVALLRIGGLRSAYVLLYLVSFYYFLFACKKTKIAYCFYRTKIGYKPLKAWWSAYKNFYIFGQTIIDKVASMAGIKTNFTFDFEGEEYLTKLADEQKGAILMGAHLGNWEMAGDYLNRIDIPINVVMYDNEYQKIKEYLDTIIRQRSYHIIPIKDDASHIYEIMNALHRHEFVCLHADRHFDHSKTITCRFLNEDAEFSESIFRMCVAVDVPLTFVYAFKETSKHYRFYASEPRKYAGSKDEKVKKLLDDYVTELEQRTKQYPLQWFNFYNFWNQNIKHAS